MARKKHHEEHHEEHPDETWLVPYSDILTLLLALFIVLFASSTIDKGKVQQMGEAFADAFSVAGYYSGSVSTFVDDAKGMVFDDKVGLGSDSKGANINIADMDLFEEGSAEIKEEAIPLLQQISILLSSERYKKFKIIVEGHTDDIDISNSYFKSNWELSAARAAAVISEFIKIGMSPYRFQAVGMAGIAPAYPNLDAYGNPIPENRKRNRRIIIRVEPRKN